MKLLGEASDAGWTLDYDQGAFRRSESGARVELERRLDLEAQWLWRLQGVRADRTVEWSLLWLEEPTAAAAEIAIQMADRWLVDA